VARKKKRANRWIQRALRKHKKGALHRQLGIPEGEKIPIALLREAAKEPNGSEIGHRARLALTLRKFRKRRKP
jgi:hypothetical protein